VPTDQKSASSISHEVERACGPRRRFAGGEWPALSGGPELREGMEGWPFLEGGWSVGNRLMSPLRGGTGVSYQRGSGKYSHKRCVGIRGENPEGGHATSFFGN